MAKQVKQFRFYSENTKFLENNYPSNINHNNLITGNIFVDYMPITQLGIQALPGTKFYLNNSDNPIIIGHTGIYEIELNGASEIIALRFDFKSIQAIENNDNAYLIIDMIYEGEGEK